MKVVIDSTGVILLAKGDILREVCSIADIETTEEVKSEVMVGLDKGRKDALYMQELMKEGKIKVTRANEGLTGKFRKDFNIGSGEASTIAVSTSRKIPMLTDDNKARKVGKILGIEVLSSLDFPPILYEKGVITYDKAKAYLEVSKKENWFSESVLTEAFNALERIRGEKDENSADNSQVA